MIIISGFKKDFLGLNKEIAYPSMEEGLKFDALNYGQVYDFTHFSLVMNRKLKSAIYVAYNIDKKSERAVRRNNYWHINVKTILNNCANIFMYNCSIIFIRYFG